MVPGQVFLKGWTDTFPVYFTLCKIVLRILRKKIFFFPHNFKKKGHSKLSKNEPEIIP